MAAKVDIAAALQQLSSVRDRIHEILEWERLARSESRPHQPPGFSLQFNMMRDLRHDLWGMRNVFAGLANSIREILARPDSVCGFDERQRHQQQLEALERDIRGLGL